MMRSLNPDLYKKMITKIDASDEKILSKVTDISEEEREDYCLQKKKKEINPNKKSDDKWNHVCYFGGKPYLSEGTVIQKRKYISANRISCTSPKPCDKNNTKKHGRILKKVSMFIDGENIGAQYVKEIIEKTSKEFDIKKRKCYIRQNDKSTAPWKVAGKEYEIKIIEIPGGPKKDKIDNIIKRHIRQILNNNKLDAICIVTSDSGYIDIVNEIRKSGKESIIVGEEKTSRKLRDVATKFIKLSSRSN